MSIPGEHGDATHSSEAGRPSLLLYAPGTAEDAAVVGDAALLGALIRTEAAWILAQADCGLLPEADAAEVVAALGVPADISVEDLAVAAASGGNPVIPLLAHLRERVAGLPGAAALHRGLTSQDVMDTAVSLVLAGTVAEAGARLGRAVEGFAALAREHRDTPALAHTLTQAAAPTMAGLRFAQWARSTADAGEALPNPAALPVQLGGAVGTRAAIRQLLERSDQSASVSTSDVESAWAARLGLSATGRPWHVDRLRVLGWAQALAGVSLAGQRIARDVLQGARPEVGELREAGGGGSSAMPQKSNPTVSVLLARTGLEAPGLLATVAQAVGSAVDERPDGAWHAEWTALARLQVGALTSARLLDDLVGRLVVDAGAMRRNLDAAGPGVVAERLVQELAPAVTAAQISAALRDARDGAEARRALEALVGSERDLDALLDPAGWTGEAGPLVDAILATLEAEHPQASEDPVTDEEGPAGTSAEVR